MPLIIVHHPVLIIAKIIFNYYVKVPLLELIEALVYQRTLYQKSYFLFKMFWKDDLSKKGCNGIWYLLCYQIRFFWFYSLDRKWKMIFLRKIQENTISSSNVLKRWSFQKRSTGIWSSLNYKEWWYFSFPKIWSYSLDGKWKIISKNTWKDGI